MMSNTNSALKTRRESEVWKSWNPKRGEIYLVNFGDGLDSEQKGLRPALVVSNNLNNKHSGIIIVSPLTSSKSKANLPVHVKVGVEIGLRNESIICIEQTRSISKNRAFIDNKPIKITKLNNQKLNEVDKAIKIQFGLF